MPPRVLPAQQPAALTRAAPAHYVFFNRSRERIHDTAFLNNPSFAGAQLKYVWPQLEPERDHYTFDAIREDLAFLRAHGKKLFVQLQDVSFDTSIVNVPPYLLRDPAFHGGIAMQYDIPDDVDSLARPGGWVARRWDAAVQARLHKLFTTLGREFDGRIEGINLAETSVTFGRSGRLWSPGYTPESYRDGIIANMAALKAAFPQSVVMQYGNFMPGESMPRDDHGYLRSVYQAAARLGVAMGGPDLLPNQRWHMLHAYPLLHDFSAQGVTAIAIQEGNYERINQKTQAPPTISEMLDFATGYLGVRFMFWFPEEPFFTREVLPALAGRRARSPR